MRYFVEHCAKVLAAQPQLQREELFRSWLTDSLKEQCDGWGQQLGYSAWVRNHQHFPVKPAVKLLKAYYPELSNSLEELPYSGLLRTRQSVENGTPFPSTREMALFSALVEAEGTFLQDYLPFKSHEERLTGALLSTMAQVGNDYSKLAAAAVGGTGPKITFVDLATDGAEKETGADVGFVSWAKVDGKTVVKVARLQVKKGRTGAERKVSGTSYRVASRAGEDPYYQGVYPAGHRNFEQLDALRQTPDLGYYLVMVDTGGSVAEAISMCLVSPAQDVFERIKANHKKDATKLGQRAKVGGSVASVPLPVFLSFGMTRANTGWGLNVPYTGSDATTMEGALATLAGEGPLPRFCVCVDSTAEGPDLRKILLKDSQADLHDDLDEDDLEADSEQELSVPRI